MPSFLSSIKKIFQKIGQVFTLVFIWLWRFIVRLYNHVKTGIIVIKKAISYVFNLIKQGFIWVFRILFWLFDNSVGLLFTKEVRPIKKTYSKEFIAWKRTKQISLFIIVILFVLNFIPIYSNTLGPVITKFMIWIGSLFSQDSIYNSILSTYSRNFSEGIAVTLNLSLVGTVIGFLIALVFSALATLKTQPTDNEFVSLVKGTSRGFVKLYTTIVRGTPMMVQAMILYWGVKGFLSWDFMTAGLVTVTINTAAYLTEVLRGSIESLDKGQKEAGLSLGLTPSQTMLNVVYSQAVKNSMASIGNEFVINIKDTAVLSVIMIEDIFRIAEIVQAKYFAVFPPFIIAAVIYLILTTTVTAILRKVERSLDIPSSNFPSAN